MNGKVEINTYEPSGFHFEYIYRSGRLYIKPKKARSDL